MAIVRLLTLPEGTPVEILTEVGKEANVHDDRPDGLIAHAAYVQDGSVHVTDIWESQEHAERFEAERLQPAVQRVLARHNTPMEGPPPQPVYLEAHDVLAAG